MKLVALMGCSKFGNTTRVVKYFTQQLAKSTDCEIEYVYPADYKIDLCVGCHNCILLGETKCPHHSQYAPIEKKMLKADGVIMASPGYMFSIMGVMKNLMDHIAYNCHRPKYFGKKAYIIGNLTKWQNKTVMLPMNNLLSAAGFEVVGSTFVDMLPFPLKESVMDKKRGKLKKGALKYSKRLNSDKPRKMKFGDIIMFKIFSTMPNIAPGILKADSIYFGNILKENSKADWYVSAKVPFYMSFIGKIMQKVVKKQLLGVIDTERLKDANGRIYNDL